MRLPAHASFAGSPGPPPTREPSCLRFLRRSIQGDSQDSLSVGAGGSGSWADLRSPRSPKSPPGAAGLPPASSPASGSGSGGGGGGGVLSPRAAQGDAATQRRRQPRSLHTSAPQPPPQQQQQQWSEEDGDAVEQFLAQQQQQRVQGQVQQQQQHSSASPTHAPPHAAVPLNRWPLPSSLEAPTLAALLTAPGQGGGGSRLAALAGEADAGVDSPVSMAAALRGELGSVSLCAGNAEEEEEFLSAATTPHQIMESTP